MKGIEQLAAFCFSVLIAAGMAGCGGGNKNGGIQQPPATTYVLTVQSTDPDSGIQVSASPADRNGKSSGATSFTLSYSAGTAVTLTAPATSGNNAFSSWSGCGSSNSQSCSITLNANAAVTANYNAPAKTTPTVTVTPGSASITTTQELPVTIAISGSSGTPTGSVVLASGAYTSASAALSNGSVIVDIPAGSLAAGTDTLTATYTPDSTSASSYNTATGTASVTVTSAATYSLTVNSQAPASGIAISVSPVDVNGLSNGTTGFTRSYTDGTAVVLSAPLSAGSYSFQSWTGCTSSPSPSVCDVTLNANLAVTATYNQAGITSITVAPRTATIGTQQQFTAAVTGNGAFSKTVTWTVSCSSCGNLSPGSIDAAGLYTTPYPAPANVTITATSVQDTSKSGSVTVALTAPAASAGPSLLVDAGHPTHAISPLIYGMNAYVLDSTTAKTANIAVTRWGGDDTSRYNYKLNVSNSASDWYFENGTGSGGLWPDGNFSDFVSAAASAGIKTVGTVPVLGWVAKDSTSCSYPKSTYPDQYGFDPYHSNCGDGESTSGSNLTGNDPTITSLAEPPPAPPDPSSVNAAWANSTWAGGWIASLVGKSETGANGGVTIWDLDNEPAWWDAVHRDVHPSPSTYDEVTNGGIGTALAIKTADPTAEVGGPVIDYWWNYFYSKKDIESGWSSGGPCYQPWSNPTDRQAHGGVPMIEYYLRQFAAAEATYGKRLLDYLVIHSYSAPQYPLNSGSGLGLTAAGDTDKQQLRMNATRVFWDPTYTDPDTASQPFPQPNYVTDSGYTSSCNVPAQAPQIVRMLRAWVTNDYPGTKTAIDEYNFGGMEAINGAVTEADILGIFGREGLDLAALWPTTNYSQQVPGTLAFAIYRNYDGNNSAFGDTALQSASTTIANTDGEGQLAVYGALRSSDNALTIVVINKTYGSLTSTLSLANFTSSGGEAQVYLYSNSNLNAVLTQPSLAITAPPTGSTTSTISASFPAQSITLLVVPN